MDFGSWSPSHSILVLFIVAGFIGQLAIYFYRTGQNDKKIDKQSEDIKQLGETFFHALERLEDRMDKRLSDMQSETNQRLSDIEANLRQLNQNHIEHLNRHHSKQIE